MKLDVGMYVRTKDGHIDKIIDTAEEWYELDGDEEEKPYKIYKLNKYYYDEEFDEETKWFLERFFVKASYNIIDLIEVGDVIIDKEGHKYPINYEFETDYNDEYKSYEITIDDHITLFLKDIKSILTKEQFSQMEYKID